MDSQAERGGALVFLSAQAGFRLGVDYADWCPKHEDGKAEDDEAIWVVSGIEAGTHFVSWSSEMNKKGMFVHIAAREVIVLKWDARLELFLKMVDEDEIERYRLGHENLSLLTRAVIFPKQWIDPWKEVSYCTSQLAVNLIQGSPLLTKDGKLCEYAVGDKRVDEESSIAAETTGESEKFDDRLSQLESLYRWSDIPKRRRVEGDGKLQGAELTGWAMDRSADLEGLIGSMSVSGGSKYQMREAEMKSEQLGLSVAEFILLGEFQMAYIAFLLGADISGMEQWKSLLRLFTTSESIATGERTNLGAEIIRCFYAQIDQCPDDLLQNELTSSNFIIAGLMSLHELTQDSTDPKIKKRINYLKDKVKEKYKMTLEEVWALQEDGPQIVG